MTEPATEAPPPAAIVDRDLEVLRKPFVLASTRQQQRDLISLRRRRLARRLLAIEWSRRARRIPGWVLAVALVTGAIVVWNAGTAARDLRYPAAQWGPVALLAVGTVVVAAVAVIAIGQALEVKPWKAVAFATAASCAALASIMWVWMAALDVRSLARPADGAIVEIGEPFDTFTEGWRGDPSVSSVTIEGIVEAPVSDRVVDGVFLNQNTPVSRCWTLVGTVDLVQAPGWPWSRSTGASDFSIRSMMDRFETSRITVTTLGSAEPEKVWRNTDECVQDPVWNGLADSSYGNGPVLFTITFALESAGMPVELEWSDARGTIPISLLGGDFNQCERTIAAGPTPSDLESVDSWCPSIVSLDERNQGPSGAS